MLLIRDWVVEIMFADEAKPFSTAKKGGRQSWGVRDDD